jgi:putative hydrolase
MDMLTEARQRGLKGLAITDHGAAIHGSIPSCFFDRLHDPVPGIRLLKGIECNVLDEQGNIDFPFSQIGNADIVLLGLHHNLPAKKGREAYTQMLLAALRLNPFVDLITHPTDESFPLDLPRIADAARDAGMVLELNNSKLALGVVQPALAVELIGTCASRGCPLAVCSDAHALNEIGNDANVRPLLLEQNFPRELIVNRSAESAFAFVETRRRVKQSFAAKRE